MDAEQQAEPMKIENPLVIIFKAPTGEIITHIHPSEECGYAAYGLIICDLVRHVAKAHDVTEDQVWDWVDKERHMPTTDITVPS